MRIHVSCTTRHICWAWTNEYMNNAGEGMNLVQKKSDMASTPSKSMSKSAQACDTQKGKNHRREVMSKTNFSHFYIHANLHEKSLHVTVPASSVYGTVPASPVFLLYHIFPIFKKRIRVNEGDYCE